jgi:nucleoside-specific outer membrane channel protein Tsx
MVALLLAAAPRVAAADVWFELLHAPCWTGSDADIKQDDGVIGEVSGSIDCFNKDFNGDTSRTLLSIKAFQPWKYGFVFLYYDITGPFNRSGRTSITDNEKGGFFGGTTVAISPKRIAEKLTGTTYDWGPLTDIYLKYEAEHVSKFGMLHYYGLAFDFKVPGLDFVSATAVARDDRAFERVDLQLGAAWQKSFGIGGQSFIFGGFFQWGLFGEGDAPSLMTKGRPFVTAQPQLLYDFGKLIRYAASKLYLGFEYQFTVNRYLIEDKSENLLQGMIRWNP